MATVSVLNTNAQLSGKTLTTAEGDWTVTGAWTFSGNQAFNGNVTIGNAVGDTLTVTSTIVSNLIFTDNLYDIGASGATRPRDLFLARNATIGGTTSFGGNIVSNVLFTDNTYDIGASGVTRPRDLFLARNATIGGTLGITGLTTFTGGLTVPSAARADLARTCEGRLTLTTAVPVTSADVTGATTIYFTPYKGDKIAVFDGTNWKVYTFTEVSLALGTLTNALPYDVFIYDNAGTLTLELLAWTNGTTRATALVLQNGVLVKSGATTRRYLGTFYTTATTTTEDSARRRLLFNYYNRVNRPLRRLETTASWTYTTATWRQSNAGATNQVEIMNGYIEDAVDLTALSNTTQSISDVERATAIGENSTSTPATGCLYALAASATNNNDLLHYAMLRTIPALGYSYYAWLEYSTAAGTSTWLGANGTTTSCGIIGMWRS